MKKSVHGGDIYGLAEKVVDFSANVNPLGMPPAAIEAVQDSIHMCSRYPDPHARALISALSLHSGLESDCIACGNGAADLIFRVATALKPKSALLVSPTFSEYELALKTVDCEIQYYELQRENHFDIQEDILSRIPSMDLFILCNPNNPTGRITDPKLMQRILETCEAFDCMLMVDECFNGFLKDPEAHSMKRYLPEHSNLILLNAFTKLYGMAGLRLGYVYAVPKRIDQLTAAGQAWAVSIPAQAGGTAALQEQAYVERTRALTAIERTFLLNGLRDLDIDVLEGAANFLFFFCSCPDLKSALLQKGYLIRDCSNYRGLGPGYYRIAVRNHEENQGLLAALEGVLKNSN